MMRWLSVGLLMACLGTAAGQSSLSRVGRAFMFGTDYVRLDEWARVNGYGLKWTVPRQEVRITMPAGTVVFQADSRRAVVKGVTVAISAPVVMKNQTAYVAAADITGTIHPILFPTKNAAGRTVRNIVLDPGHGGKDPGNQEGRRREKDYTLVFARELGGMLARAGYKVSLTRNSDTYIDLPVRPDIARRRGADLFISLHFNSADGAGGSAVQGAEVYCMTPPHASSTNARGEGAGAGAYPGNRSDAKNILLAYHIQKALIERGSEDRGVKRARFAILRAAEMPSVLIEAAFMTHPSDARRIYDVAQRRRLVEAIVEGVAAYRRVVERAPVNRVQPSTSRPTGSRPVVRNDAAGTGR